MKDKISRRSAIELGVAAISFSSPIFGNVQRANAEAEEVSPIAERAAWIDEWIANARVADEREASAPEPSKASSKVLRLARFADEMWYLTDDINFSPNKGQENAVSSVLVPKGFVTDLASIPRLFWSLVPRDGPYIYSAIIHDYLYWSQQEARDRADLTFKFSMQDFQVGTTTIEAVYRAVRSFGGRSWDANAAAKKSGEKRLLIKFPSGPMIRWQDWRADPANFS